MPIRRGCLSYHEEGALYRLTGHGHLGRDKSSVTRLCVWQSLRGSSQLEGFHPHHNKWVTGTRVSPALFQAQGFPGLTYWNCAIDHRHLRLPSVFDPLLTAWINAVSTKEYREPKYLDFVIKEADTGKQFGLDYSEDHIEAVDLIETTASEAKDELVFESSLDSRLQSEL